MMFSPAKKRWPDQSNNPIEHQRQQMAMVNEIREQSDVSEEHPALAVLRAVQQQQQQSLQSSGVDVLSDMGVAAPDSNTSLAISNEIKRLQQLNQQFSTSNALIMIPGNSIDQSTNSFLQSLFDNSQQRANLQQQQNRFETLPSVNPLLQNSSGLDARLLMAPGQLPDPVLGNFGALGLAQHVVGIGELPLPSPHSIFHRDGSRRMKGGVIEPFPEKLHRLLMEVEAAERSDVISWVGNGRAFVIHKPDEFFKEIVPLYFRQTRLSSFKRQLNLYGFEMINSGPARGGYFHKDFVKDSPELCRRMRRVAVKVSKEIHPDDLDGEYMGGEIDDKKYFNSDSAPDFS